MIVDEDGVPWGWWDVRLTPEEWEDFFEAAEAGDLEAVERIVEGAYDRLYAPVG